MKKLFTMLLAGAMAASISNAQIIGNDWLVGLDVEETDLSDLGMVVDNTGAQDFTGYTSYKLYAVFGSQDYRLAAIAGINYFNSDAYGPADPDNPTPGVDYQNEQHDLIIGSTGGTFYNNALGSSAGGLNGSLLPIPGFGSLAHDTHLTIGEETFVGSSQVSALSTDPDGTFFNVWGSTNGSGELNGQDVVIFTTPDNAIAMPGVDNRIFIGQLTTNGTPYWELNLTGQQGNDPVSGNPIPVESWAINNVDNFVGDDDGGPNHECGCAVGLIAPAPADCAPFSQACTLPAGCTDANACNFDAGATEDDGSCDYLSCACDANAAGTAVQISMIDTFGDGWNGNTYEISTPDGTIVATGDLDNATIGDGLNDGSDFICLDDGCYTLTVGGGGFVTETDVDILLSDGTEIIGLEDGGSVNFSINADCGCTDDMACNYDATATSDDGSCEFLSCAGCTDAAALNFDAAAILDDGSCVTPTCGETTPDQTVDACYDNGAADTYSFDAAVGEQVAIFITQGQVEDGSFDTFSVYDGTDNTGTLLFQNDDIDDTDLAGLVFQSTGGSLFIEILSDGSVSCTDGDFDNIIIEAYCLAAVLGCTDATACNFNAAADTDDGSCDFVSCAGCTDAAAINFDGTATIDDGSCVVPTCMDPADNYTYCYGENEDAVFAVYTATGMDQVSILFNAGSLESCCDDIIIYDGTDATGAVLYDSNVDGHDLTGVALQSTSGSIALYLDSDGSVSCQSGSTQAVEFDYDVYCGANVVLGCTDDTACNYDMTATVDDGSCDFITCAGCTDDTACNYDATATLDDMSCCFDNCVTVDVTDGGFPLEVSWEIQSLDGTVLASGGPGSTGACLADDCYAFVMIDSFGDGWNGAEYTVTDDASGNVITTGGADFTTGSDQTDYFTNGSGMCPMGCTDETACNFDAAAVVDDGSCEFISCAGVAGPLEVGYEGIGSTVAGYTECDVLKADWIQVGGVNVPASDVTGWNWQLTPVAVGGDVLTYASPNFISLAPLNDFTGTFQYGIDYEVLVAPIYLGNVIPFDPAQVRTITTGAEPLTVVNPGYCGNDYTLNDLIGASATCGADEYTFQFVSQNDGSIYTSAPSSSAYLFLNTVSGLAYGDTYDVSVSITTNGVNFGFGASCPINIPSPVTQVNPGFNVANAGALSPNYWIGAINVGAADYTFRFVNQDMTSPDIYFHHGSGSTFALFSQIGLLADGATYDVTVRAELGTCVADCSPGVGTNVEPTFDIAGSYGPVQTIEIAGGVPSIVQNENEVVEQRSISLSNAAIYPNPSNGDFFNLNVTDVVDAETINVEIFDVFGKLVFVEQIAVNDGNVNRIIELSGDMTSGVYMVNIVVNGNVQTERLVIQR